MNAPLEGLRIADFSRVLAGPLATMTLADLGAEVVKVERPGAGDDTRQWGPPWTEHASSYFECVNRSKRSITLDLRDPADLAVAVELATGADVVVENFLTGTMDRLGLGYDALAAANPGLVYCSITGFGSGAGARLPGYDFVVQAVGGLMSITGQPEGDPTKVGVALVDVLTGKDAVIGILAALREREVSGRGQRIEVNLLSSLLGSLVNQASAVLTTGRSPSRMGNQHPSIAPYETLHCADGLLAVACGNDAQFARLCEVLGRPGLAEDVAVWAQTAEEAAPEMSFRSNPDRVAHRQELIAALEEALAEADAATWVTRLNAAGIAAGPVNDLAAAIAFADSLGLDPTMPVGQGHPDQIRHPVTWGRSRLPDPTPPPDLGEHTDQIRAQLGHQPKETR
ncbi:MAG: CoA transferase [Nocardioides sp.]|uniref:CaiB/BaiF CoA transferase family protein n=1 Tax=Nocardioides sp. TaxID=35761 RepID=UPI0039E4A98D